MAINPEVVRQIFKKNSLFYCSSGLVWRMKVLIQNCHTHSYLVSLDEWTDLPEGARTFPSTERAMAFCMEHRIPAAQVVLKFEYDQYDIKVPVSKECEELGRN